MIGFDYLTTAIGSRYFGGSKAAMWGAALGLLVGILFFPIGILIGPFLGAASVDFIFRRRTDQAIRSGVGAFLGFWSALPIKLILKGIMIGWFLQEYCNTFAKGAVLCWPKRIAVYCSTQ